MPARGVALAERLWRAKRSEEDTPDVLGTKDIAQPRARQRRQREYDQAADLVAALDFIDS